MWSSLVRLLFSQGKIASPFLTHRIALAIDLAFSFAMKTAIKNTSYLHVVILNLKQGQPFTKKRSIEAEMAYSAKTRDADLISDQVFEYILFINMFYIFI